MILVALLAARPAMATEIFEIDNEGISEVYMPFAIESARAAGMGRITSIARDGAIATWWNPAFLAFEKERSLIFSDADYSLFVPGDGYVRSATASAPLPFGPHGLVAGFGFKRLDWGIEASRVFQPIDPNEAIVPFDHAYVLSLGYPATSSLSAGISLEYLWHHTSEEISGGAFSMGVGLAYQRPIRYAMGSHGGGARGEGDDERGTERDVEPGMDRDVENGDGGSLALTPLAGISLLHVGEKLEFDGGSADVARQLRGGIGLGVALEPPPGTRAFDKRRLHQFELVTALEVYFPAVRREQVSQKMALVHLGAELTLFGMLSGRVGFIDDDRRFSRARDETFGFGVGLPRGLPLVVRFDWASVPGRGDDRIERRTLSVALR